MPRRLADAKWKSDANEKASSPKHSEQWLNQRTAQI